MMSCGFGRSGMGDSVVHFPSGRDSNGPWVNVQAMFFRKAKEPQREQLAARPVQRGGGTPILPTTAVLQQILDEYGLKHAIDDDGDLTVKWEMCAVFFFYYGDKRDVLQARLYLNRRFDADMRA